MDAMYQSLGGDGYISPGRRSYHPSTDLRDNQHKHRIARLSLATLTSVLVLATALSAFFFFPRPLSSQPSGSGSSASFFTFSVDQQRLSFVFNHTISITNTNYYPLSLQSALLTFTLPPLTPTTTRTSANDSSQQSLPPVLCVGPHIVGTFEAGTASVSALQTSEWLVNGSVVGEAGQAVPCVREWCEQSGAYELWMDALLRVSYVQVQAALVTDTVTVSVDCPQKAWQAEATERSAER